MDILAFLLLLVLVAGPSALYLTYEFFRKAEIPPYKPNPCDCTTCNNN